MSFDIIVAGGGPVGLLLAIELRLAGLTPVVLERLTEPDQTIKAGAVHAITGEALHRRGLRDALAAGQLKTIKEMLRLFGTDEPITDDAAYDVMKKFADKAPRGHFAGIFKLDASKLELGVELRRGTRWPVIAGSVPGKSAVLIRPDGYVAWALRTGADFDPSSLTTSLARRLGAAPVRQPA